VTQIRTQLSEASQAGPLRITAGWLHKLGKFGLRAGRSIAFRSGNLVGRVRLVKRNVIFPIRNALLRHKPLRVQADGLSYFLSPEGAIPLEMWSRRYFERHELDFIVGALQPGMTFIDIGANVGLFSIPAAKKVKHGKVYAFEPSAWTVEILAKNAGLNSASNLETVRSAVGDYTGEATLQINVAGKDGLNTIGKPVHEDSEIAGTEKVPITTLDGFLRRRSISRVDVMKVDVEGAELMVFRGASDLLSKPTAPLILYEGGFLSKGFGYHPVETMWMLQGLGYSFFVIDSKTGQISIPAADRAYDAMVIAVKTSHPLYPAVKGMAR